MVKNYNCTLVKQWKIYLGDRISKNIETMSQSEFNKVDSGEHMTKYTYQLELLSAYLFSPLTGLLSVLYYLSHQSYFYG